MKVVQAAIQKLHQEFLAMHDHSGSNEDISQGRREEISCL